MNNSPQAPMHGWTDHRIEQALGRLLQIGVLTAAIVVFGGAMGYLSTHAGTIVDYRVFRAAEPNTRSVHAIVAYALRLRPLSVIQFGLLILIALPIVRVALSLIAFALRRDRLYVMLTAVVLGILACGLTGLMT